MKNKLKQWLDTIQFYRLLQDYSVTSRLTKKFWLSKIGLLSVFIYPLDISPNIIEALFTSYYKNI